MRLLGDLIAPRTLARGLGRWACSVQGAPSRCLILWAGQAATVSDIGGRRRFTTMDRVIDQTSSEHEGCKRMQAIPGIGPVTATAIVAAIGTGQAFGKGRDFAAWIGLVPRQHSTGGKQKLLGISKRGNPYLRMLFVQGARAVLQKRSHQTSGLSSWLEQLTSHKQCNVAVVALANKLARMAWAVLAREQAYRPPALASGTRSYEFS